MAASRVTWVDNARGIGIILVVYGHVARGLEGASILADSSLYRFVDAAVYSFHMPLFFFLSGLFFLPGFRRYGGGLFGRKIGVIVYPYLVWSISQLGIKIILSRYTNSGADVGELFTIFWLPVEQFWFLYSLFLITTVHIVLTAVSDRLIGINPKTVLVVLAAALLLFFARPVLPGVFQIQTVATYMIYFSLGIWFSEAFHGSEKWHDRPFLALPVCFLLLCYVVVLKGYYPADSPLMQLALALTGVGSAIVLSRFVGGAVASTCSFLGRYSLEIFCMHIIAASGLRIIVQHFMHISSPLIHLVLGVVAGLVLPIVFVKVLEKLSLGSLLFSFPFALLRPATPTTPTTPATPANRK